MIQQYSLSYNSIHQALHLYQIHVTLLSWQLSENNNKKYWTILFAWISSLTWFDLKLIIVLWTNIYGFSFKLNVWLSSQRSCLSVNLYLLCSLKAFFTFNSATCQTSTSFPINTIKTACILGKLLVTPTLQILKTRKQHAFVTIKFVWILKWLVKRYIFLMSHSVSWRRK